MVSNLGVVAVALGTGEAGTVTTVTMPNAGSGVYAIAAIVGQLAGVESEEVRRLAVKLAAILYVETGIQATPETKQALVTDPPTGPDVLPPGSVPAMATKVEPIELVVDDEQTKPNGVADG